MNVGATTDMMREKRPRGEDCEEDERTARQELLGKIKVDREQACAIKKKTVERNNFGIRG